MRSRDLSNAKDKLNGVGWFLPPYVPSGFLDLVALHIARGNGQFTQDDLEKVLAGVYCPERMASMVLNRYPQMPVIMLFAETIAEAVMAHFSGLHHVAVGGLIPVIEGAGGRLAGERGLDEKGHVKEVFRGLASYVKEDVIKRRIGATEEIVNMLDSFLLFLKIIFTASLRHIPSATGRTGTASSMEPTRMLSMEGRSISTRPSRQ